jgi:hypothetical protein
MNKKGIGLLTTFGRSSQTRARCHQRLIEVSLDARPCNYRLSISRKGLLPEIRTYLNSPYQRLEKELRAGRQRTAVAKV